VDEHTQQHRTVSAARRAGLDAEELWIRYFAVGGSLAQVEVEAYLSGVQVMPALERDVLAHALNEVLEELGHDVRAPYSGELEQGTPDPGMPGAAGGFPDPLSALGAAGAVFLTPDEAEARRIAALRATDLLDSPAEERFDSITRRAREHFGVSSAIVALIAEHRQFLKSVVGPIGQNLERESTFCNQTIRSAGPMVVLDTHTDERFRANPLVVGEPHIRFYAGHPLLGPGGWTIGTLCVIDQSPRGFSDEDQRMLRSLAESAQREITP
jgi:hypothetical protein